MCQFSHLHVHTQYSLLDGAASIPSLYKKAKEFNMPGLAITDHGNMYGAFEFVAQAWKDTIVTGKDELGKDILKPRIKPIVGCEFYVVKDRFVKAFTKEQKDQRYHQVLLAKNKKGYENLMKLTSLGFIEGYYSKYPRVDKGLIEKYHEGLIATTCCIGAYVPQTILHKDEAAAEAEFNWWYNLFGDDYFIEIQRHNIPEQEVINNRLLGYAKKYNVPVIATNDSHYTERDDYNAHDILLCINTGEKQSTPGFDDFVNDDAQVKNRRFKFPNDQFYFKSPDEMKRLFADVPEAIDNTNIIVDRVEYLNLKTEILLPNFPIPKEFEQYDLPKLNQWTYLQHLTYQGAKNRYGEIAATTQERIDFELEVIKHMDFAGYFLIVSDFIKAGRDMGVFIGPGRGSAAGSVVAYCIGITNIDPIKYNLLFERFLNPDRKTMPDIDTDFDDDGRQKVIDYVVKKYGENQVAQIVTYGTMAAKSSIKDVARVMDLPLSDSNALAKLVPDRPGTELRRVLKAPFTKKEGEKSLEEKEAYNSDDIENIKQLRKIYAGTDLKAQVLHEAERLEGSVRNTGIHASAIIIAPKDLTELMPVATSKDSTLWVTQIEGNSIEDAGVIKMDFLGLKTLSILKTALSLIKANHNVDIDLDAITLEDEKTYRLYQRAETNGTFQFESPGMQKHLRELKPDQFPDLIAMNALYRPGPMQYISKYVDRKHGREVIEYDLPEMEEYLAETYGITVYQEQVMLLSQKLGDFTKGQADILRKAMGKKDRKTLDDMKSKFMEGATAKGLPADKLEKVWTDWEAFAQYAFNKSHSTCYAFVAYQTAYLKAHYPAEYMSAVLNHAADIDKITFFMEECKRMGIKVLGPDVNESKKGFAPNMKGEIRFGLGGLKGVGEAAIETLVEEREKHGPFKDMYDMMIRVNQRTVNKKSLESLIYSGAFDCFNPVHRAQYFHVAKGESVNGLEKIIRYGNSMLQNSQATTNTLFGDLSSATSIYKPTLPPCEPWTLTEQLGFEKDVTGIFMSGHPLDHFKFELKHYGITNLADYGEIQNLAVLPIGKTIRLAGMVTASRQGTTKAGKSYMVFNIEDFTGKAEFFLWSNDSARFAPFLTVGRIIYLKGSYQEKKKYDANRELVANGFEFKITNMQLLDSLKQQNTKGIELQIHPAMLSNETINFLEKNIRRHPGNSFLNIKLKDAEKQYDIEFTLSEKGVSVNEELAEFLLHAAELDVKVITADN